MPAFLERLLGCRHRHLSRIFTIKHRTYRVCFDCGREFDLPSVSEPVHPGLKGKSRSAPAPFIPADACESVIPSRWRADVKLVM